MTGIAGSVSTVGAQTAAQSVLTPAGIHTIPGVFMYVCECLCLQVWFV